MLARDGPCMLYFLLPRKLLDLICHLAVNLIVYTVTAELLELIDKIGNAKVKGSYIQAEIYKAPSCIWVTNINTNHYDVDFITLYFESPRSGGGEVQNVQLLGNGEAIVTFKDPKGITT